MRQLIAAFGWTEGGSFVSEWADVHNRGRAYRPYNPGMNELMFLVEEAVEGGFTARAIRVPVFTEADTLDQINAEGFTEVVRHFIACG